MALRSSLLLLVLAALFVELHAAEADDPAPPAVTSVAAQKAAGEDDFNTKRIEPAAFPVIGGNSDVGLQFGAAAELTRFGNGVVPYMWNMDLLASASVKGGTTGAEIAQQAYLWDIDLPGLFGGRLRLNPLVEFHRTVNQGYFGFGNASSGVAPPGADGRYFQYLNIEANLRFLARYEIAGPLYALSSTLARYVNPTAYGGSKLATDAAAPAPNGSRMIYGLQHLGIGSEGIGLLYDTRDSEVFTRSGWLNQMGLRYSQGFPLSDNTQWGEYELISAHYVPLGGPFVLAIRAAADFKFGHVPFFELSTGGVFVPDDMIGGSAAIRGVPFGRYLGQIKVVGNLELRAMLLRFRLFGQAFQIGNDIFADTGRVWLDYSFRSPLDGNVPGLKWGAGVGQYLLWGQAALFRLEVAYSPDAVAENAGFPFGIYIQNGVSF